MSSPMTLPVGPTISASRQTLRLLTTLDDRFSGGKAGAKLAYFAASILWRGSAHQWRFGKQLLTRISLGPYEEELRQYLLGQTQFPRNAVLAVDVIADAILRRGVIPPFGGKREGGI